MSNAWHQHDIGLIPRCACVLACPRVAFSSSSLPFVMAFVSSLTCSCALVHPSSPPSLLFPCSLARPPPFFFFSFLFFSFHLLLCSIRSPFLFFLYALLVHVSFIVLFFSFPLKKNPSLKILEKHIMRSISTLPLQVNLKSGLGVVHV